ncbi:hypothetical protein [Actinacidiphila sp. bgisy167]|uniref:hypothetical protein n=1 Tax=Actinacidiphila sp. bgisy167 TaxID=3413797 RepID=UPI003D715482
MDRTRVTGRRYVLYGFAAAVAAVVAVWLGAPLGAIFILAVALMCPLLMLLMLHTLRVNALRGSDADRRPVVEAVDSAAGRRRGPQSGERPPGG